MCKIPFRWIPSKWPIKYTWHTDTYYSRPPDVHRWNDSQPLEGVFGQGSGDSWFSRWRFQTFLNVHPYLGKWSNLTTIFQMGWFNHLDFLESGTPWGGGFWKNICIKHCNLQCFMHLKGLKRWWNACFLFFILADFNKTCAGIEKNKQKKAWQHLHQTCTGIKKNKKNKPWSSQNLHRHQKNQKKTKLWASTHTTGLRFGSARKKGRNWKDGSARFLVFYWSHSLFEMKSNSYQTHFIQTWCIIPWTSLIFCQTLISSAAVTINFTCIKSIIDISKSNKYNLLHNHINSIIVQ